MTDVLQDKVIVKSIDINSHVFNIIMQSDMAKAFPSVAISLSRQSPKDEKTLEKNRNG